MNPPAITPTPQQPPATPLPSAPVIAPPATPTSSATPSTPESQTSPAIAGYPMPHRWTIETYRKLAETRAFYGIKSMLINGEILTMPMPEPPHDLALGLIDDWLRSVFVNGYHVRVQMGFDVGTQNDPGPDLAVIAGVRRDLAGRTPTTAVMVVEVADSSLSFDTTTKAELYATAGVPEYWVLDLEHCTLIVFRDPQPLPKGLGATAYRTHQTLSATDRVSPLAAPNSSAVVADLLP